MQPDPLSVGPLLALQAPFQIPKYQRGYAWDKDQIKDFVDDISRLQQEPGRRHFFGGVISIRRNQTRTPAGIAYEVVDGQQRITTFNLAVRALTTAYREVAAEARGLDNPNDTLARMAETTADLDEETYLRYFYADDAGNRIPMLKLQPSRRDADYFVRLMNGNPLRHDGIHSHALLRRAYNSIRVGLVDRVLNAEDIDPAQKFDMLRGIRELITDRCFLIHIVSDDDSEAYQLFSVLNDRGMSLSEAELVRTHTLRLLEGFPAQQSVAEEHWEPIVQSKPSEVLSFLRSYFASREGSRAPSKDLHDQYERRFFDFPVAQTPDDSHAIRNAVDDLADEYGVFTKIRRGDWPFTNPGASLWTQTRLLRLVKSIKLDASLPVLMSAHHRGEDFFAELVGILERFGFRYIVSGGHASEMGDRLFEEAAKLRDDAGYSLDDLAAVCRRLLWKYARDNAFESALVNRMEYQTTGPNNLLRYFLSTVEDHYDWLQHGTGDTPQADTVSVLDLSRATIEHIYPQRPRRGEETPELNPHMHSLGNLSFWGPGENPRAGNLSFDEKKARNYPRSRIQLITELADVAAWNAPALAERQERLVEWAKRLFPIPLGADDVAPPEGAWLVQQNPDSEYRDREGELYDFPYRIPNAQYINEGDILVCYRSQAAAPDGRRVLGVGRVAELLPDADRLLAVYDRYAAFDPPLSFDDLGGDPRSSRRNSINRLEDVSFVTRLLARAGVPSGNELPSIEPDLDELRAQLEDEFPEEEAEE